MSFGEFIKTPNTIGLWHLNGNSNDDSGNSLNGSDTSITYGKNYGKFNEGALFNQTNSQIELPRSVLLDLYSFSHTTICWFNLAQFPTTRWSYLYNKGVWGYSETQFICRITPAGKIQYAISSNRDEQLDWANSIDSISLNTTYCLAATWDKSNRIIRMYLNGSEIQISMTVLGATLPIYPKRIAFSIGYEYGGYGGNFKGNIDEVIFENRVWSPVEIQKYYTYSKGWF